MKIVKQRRIRKHFEPERPYNLIKLNADKYSRDIIQKLAWVIKQERMHKKVSLRDLYRITNISIKTIKDFEEGKNMPKLETVFRLAYVLGIRPNRLLHQVVMGDYTFLP